MPDTIEAPPAGTPDVSPTAPVDPSPFGTSLSKPMEEAFSQMGKYAKGDDATKIARARGEAVPEKVIEKAIAPVEPPAKEETKVERPKPELDENYDDEPEEEPKPEVKEEKVEAKKADKSEKAEDLEDSKTERKKESPWKLLDKYKKSLLEREAELAELRTKAPQIDPTVSEKLSTYEKQLKQYEEELRFTNYQKHPEFLEKYQKPYEEAFDKAGKELRGLKISFMDGNGDQQSRDITLQDISVLASMDPAEARAIIKEKFPQDGEEVKYHIKEIRRLAEARAKVLDDAKKGADEKMQQMMAQQQKAQEESMRLWQQYNKEAADKYDFLKPREGDTERNERLAKAQTFVDKAWSQNPSDPKLTPEQRAEIIKSHAALRNRAIAYTVLRHELKSVKARNAELEQELKNYQKSEPTNGERKSPKPEPLQTETLEGVIGNMAHYAKGGSRT